MYRDEFHKKKYDFLCAYWLLGSQGIVVKLYVLFRYIALETHATGQRKLSNV